MKPEHDSAATTVLELIVNNHPGALSHVCGMFARRAFNLDAIVCLPMDDARYSRIWLRVAEDHRLRHLENQLCKLHDVHAVRRRHPDRATLHEFWQASRHDVTTTSAADGKSQ